MIRSLIRTLIRMNQLLNHFQSDRKQPHWFWTANITFLKVMKCLLMGPLQLDAQPVIKMSKVIAKAREISLITIVRHMIPYSTNWLHFSTTIHCGSAGESRYEYSRTRSFKRRSECKKTNSYACCIFNYFSSLYLVDKWFGRFCHRSKYANQRDS